MRMPRAPRVKQAGFYHVINRGVERRVVFYEEEDFEKFLEILTFVSSTYELYVHSFCLMNNHYHILIETTKENLSDAFKYLNSNYSTYFNKKHKRCGHLWQSRFYSSLLFDEEHFWIVTKYIERNPLKANIVKKLDYYKYQSLFQYLYNQKYINLLQNSKIKNMSQNEYYAFLDSDLDDENFDKVYTTPKITIDRNKSTKVLTRRLENFFEQDRDINKIKNAQEAFTYGYSNADIAKFLELSPATIAKYISK